MTTTRRPETDDARQPDLPGAETVRDQEVPHPTWTLPRADPADFDLTAESGAGQTLNLFTEGDDAP